MDNNLNELARYVHQRNERWWIDPRDGKSIDRNKGELLMLIVSEIAECMEGERTGKMDDHLIDRPMAEVELADALIRIFDYAGAFGYDIDGAFVAKLNYNDARPDHQPSVRMQTGGKKW